MSHLFSEEARRKRSIDQRNILSTGLKNRRHLSETWKLTMFVW